MNERPHNVPSGSSSISMAWINVSPPPAVAHLLRELLKNAHGASADPRETYVEDLRKQPILAEVHEARVNSGSMCYNLKWRMAGIP